MKNNTQNVKWMDVSQAASYLSVSKATLYAYMKDGRLPFFYLAGTRNRRIRQEDLDALLVPGNRTDSDEEDDS
jgi:excisionase family DNA binding protein